MYIYKIVNTINELIYIGKSKDPENRFNEHLKCSETDYNHPFYNAIRKYGKEYFSLVIIKEVLDDTVDIEEKNHIKELNTLYPAGYNLTEGGTGGSTTHNKMWVTDGFEDRYIFLWDSIPPGFTKGRSNCKFNDGEFQRECGKKAHSPEIHKKKVENGVGDKISKSKLGKSNPHVLGNKNPTKRQDVREKLKLAANNRPILICPYCGKEGKASPGMYAFHFEKCKWKN